MGGAKEQHFDLPSDITENRLAVKRMAMRMTSENLVSIKLVYR